MDRVVRLNASKSVSGEIRRDDANDERNLLNEFIPIRN